MTVRAGEVVDTDTLIGLAGATGRVTGPHLHWTAKINGATVSPLELIEATALVSR
jgi:murein DD-endopeptidase MepM/ murein hydrolase activator NlpD